MWTISFLLLLLPTRTDSIYFFLFKLRGWCLTVVLPSNWIIYQRLSATGESITYYSSLFLTPDEIDYLLSHFQRNSLTFQLICNFFFFTFARMKMFLWTESVSPVAKENEGKWVVSFSPLSCNPFRMDEAKITAADENRKRRNACLHKWWYFNFWSFLSFIL